MAKCSVYGVFSLIALRYSGRSFSWALSNGTGQEFGIALDKKQSEVEENWMMGLYIVSCRGPVLQVST